MERLIYLASSPVTVSLASMAKVLDTEDSSFCEIRGILSTHSVKALSDDLDAGLETRSTINYDNAVNASLEITCHLLVLEIPYFYAPVSRITNEMSVLEVCSVLDHDLLLSGIWFPMQL
ncbi:hypothetical protein T08_10163 [Trichinella sp. T8]|nr:hypothetical protein T08_10163 [Trichinella sp. T8]